MDRFYDGIARYKFVFHAVLPSFFLQTYPPNHGAMPAPTNVPNTSAKYATVTAPSHSTI